MSKDLKEIVNTALGYLSVSEKRVEQIANINAGAGLILLTTDVAKTKAYLNGIKDMLENE